MILQGFPIAKMPALVEATSNCILGDLAGNAVSLPVLLALVMSTIAAVDWRDVTISDVQDLDVDTALLAFEVMTASGPADAAPQRKKLKRAT